MTEEKPSAKRLAFIAGNPVAALENGGISRAEWDALTYDVQNQLAIVAGALATSPSSLANSATVHGSGGLIH